MYTNTNRNSGAGFGICIAMMALFGIFFFFDFGNFFFIFPIFPVIIIFVIIVGIGTAASVSKRKKIENSKSYYNTQIHSSNPYRSKIPEIYYPKLIKPEVENKSDQFCQDCGVRLNKGAVFCQNCGSRVISVKEIKIESDERENSPKSKYCPFCGTRVDDDSIYCSSCGAGL